MLSDELTIIDLFAGVGGLSLGFEMEGFHVLLANEYDPSIAEAYIKNRNNPNMIVADIKTLPVKETFGKYKGKVTVVVGGPPCQGYSQKGQRKTINDDRNFLFRYFVEVVREVEPLYFVMENVPNLLTAEKGFFKNEITTLFNEMGYTINADVLCAANYGVPQNRNRAFIIGKKDSQTPVCMPEKEKKITTIWDAISDLNYLDSGEGANEQDYLNAPMTEYQEKIRAGSKKLFGHIATNHSEVALTRMRMIPPKGGKEFLPPEQLTKSIYSGTWERMDADDVSVTITTRFDTPASGKNRMPGFSTFFKSTSLDELVNLVPTLRDTLKQSPWSVQRAFLVGVFDGRSSADIDKKKHKVRMLALDCISDDIGAFLSEMVEMTGIRYNYNTHRDRLKGGRPRNPQLRIRDVEDFMSKIGLISPRRVNLLKDAYEHNYSCVEIIEDSSTLLGLKTFNLK